MDKEVVLITGASGLIGHTLAGRLVERFAVAGFDCVEPSHPIDGVSYVTVDLVSPKSVEDAVRELTATHGKRIASVIHLAAYYDFSGEPSPLYDEVTVQGTRRLLRSLKYQTNTEQFIYASSMLVYAPCRPGHPINEESPLEPKWDYPKSKVEAEQVILREHDEIPVVIVRMAGVYDDCCRSLPLSHQIQRIYERRVTATVFPGNLEHGQAFVHLDDLVDAVERMIDRRTTLPKELTLLVGEPETLSYGELQQRFGRLIHQEDWVTTEIPKAVAKAGAWVQGALPTKDPFIKPWMIDLADDHYELDISRARILLDWETRRSLRETLPLMVRALERDPVAWYKENGLTLPEFLKQTVS